MPRLLSGGLIFIALAGALWLAAQRAAPGRMPDFAIGEYRLTTGRDPEPLFESGYVTEDSPTESVHSGTLTELPDGGVLAAWFGGSREGARDVAIYASRWNGSDWSTPHVLLDRMTAERELRVSLRKLGNPVLFTGTDGRLWLFFVTTSIGGWSTSSVSFKTSSDGGQHWAPARRLITSPFNNISTLARGRPVNYTDGSIGLPTYHELAGKFAEWLRISPDGEVLSKRRISQGKLAIQPSPVITGRRNALTLMRRVSDSPKTVLLSETNNGGQSWSKPQATNLPNPDAGIAAQFTGKGDYLLAYNHVELGRGSLDLALSTDGAKWRRIQQLEIGTLQDEFSYPYLIRTRAGDYHLIYTWQRQRMAYARFNDAWLETRR